MFTTFLLLSSGSVALLRSSTLTFMLVFVSIIFIVIIAFAVIKNYKLKADNERLSKLNPLDKEKSYTDFTDGHMYENNN